MNLDEELSLAVELVDLADVITMTHFQSQSLVIETKADRTEVTIADRSSEQAIRDHLALRRPDHGVLGEEHGISDANARSRWIIDPIDGTSNYVRGVPLWATLLALEVDGEIVLGMVSAPALGKRWWATRGLGAFVNGKPIQVSRMSVLAESSLSYSEGPWEAAGMRDGIDALRSTVSRQRAFGDFWQHMLVAEGAIDIAAEAIVSLWDLAAVKVIIEEAGGRFSDLGGSVRADGGSALSTNGVLHDDALAMLRGEPETR
jgi:histidinol-phosphatase